MKKTLLAIVMLLPGLGMSGQCDPISFPGGQSSDSEEVPSVILRIKDAGGTTLSRASITVRLNGGALVEGACDGNCNGIVLAYETTGQFDVTVSAPGYVTWQERIAVVANEDGSHPITEERTVTMQVDQSVAVLAGCWYTSNYYGQSVLRFDNRGRIVGAILYDRMAAGDGNIYVAYNGRQIAGASGQGVVLGTAAEPTRVGDVFYFSTTTVGFPVGFIDARMSADYNTLTGTLGGTAVVYTRLDETPAALRDP